jgi:tetratricopeptide (TPR) repeat protein
MRHLVIGLVLLALAALPASAATLKLKDGSTVNCKVKRYDTATKTLYVTTEDGRDAQYTMDQLDGRSVYVVNASLVPKNDAKAEFQVANFARDAGLYAHAMRRYNEAVKLDPSLKGAVDAEVAKGKHMAAQMCIDNAKKAVAKSDLAEAEKWLKALVEKLPDQPEAAQASELLEKHYAQRRADKVAKADAKAAESLRKDVEQGKKRYGEMVEKTKKGLQARGGSQAENLFRDALTDGKAVMKEIDDIERKYSDPDVRAQALEYRSIVTEQLVEVYLHLASQRATQSDYKGAQKEVNQALSLDPKNERALSMRARIEEYASQGIGWRPWI